MFRYMFLFSLCFSAIWGGGTVIIEEEPLPISIHTGFYLSAGVGSFVLNDDITSEELSANTVLLIAGYRYNTYLSLEARYYRSIGDEIDYDPGSRMSPSATYESTFTNLAAYIKVAYPTGDWTPYLLLGYGQIKLTNIAGADREENSVQYGVGVSYQVTDDLGLFVDLVRAYDDRGFDGRAIQDDLTIDLLSVGVTYRF